VTWFEIESCWPAPTTNDCRFGACRWIAVAVGQQLWKLGAGHHSLVADQRACGRAEVDAQVVLKDRSGAG
jgi:hypothetical protein